MINDGVCSKPDECMCRYGSEVFQQGDSTNTIGSCQQWYVEDIFRRVSYDVSYNVSQSVIYCVSHGVSYNVSHSVSHCISYGVSHSASYDASYSVSHSASHGVNVANNSSWWKLAMVLAIVIRQLYPMFHKCIINFINIINMNVTTNIIISSIFLFLLS